MANPMGELTVKARGNTYRLHLGMSVIAELQEKYGERVEAILAPPTQEEGEEAKLPDLQVMVDVFLGALQRHHADEADRWLVDDIIAENHNAFGELLVAGAPEPKGGEATPKGKKKAAA